MRLMRYITRAFVLAALVASSASCGNALRDSRAPVFLVIDSMQAAAGAKPGTFFAFLLSDVQTVVTSGSTCTVASPCITFFNDVGQASMKIIAKDAGGTTPTAPTANNNVTISRYHVAYRRADGRNTQGVDVPYAFDGFVTATIGTAGTTVGFELVRNVAKIESPLVQLVTNRQIVTMMAEVTFYGKDLVGNDISVTGHIQIDFGNFGDF